MQVEVWLQDWTRKGNVEDRRTGPATSKWEVVEHFRNGLYTKVRVMDVGNLETPIEGAGACWSVSEESHRDVRPGDILVVSKGGQSRRTGYVVFRDVDGCRLQKIDIEAEKMKDASMPTLPAFVTNPSRQSTRMREMADA